MDERILRERISELADTLSALAQSGENPTLTGTYAPHTPTRSAVDIQELLDQIKFQMKYLIFDLEATRRENNYLREMLERRWNFGEAADNQ